MNCRIYLKDLLYLCGISITSMIIGSLVASIAYQRENRQLQQDLKKAEHNSTAIERYVVAKGYADFIMVDDKITLKWN